MKNQDINKIIERLSICDEAKDVVRDLVRALGHEIVVEVKPKLKVGQVWRHITADILIIKKPSNSNWTCLKEDYNNNFLSIDVNKCTGYGTEHKNINTGCEGVLSNNYTFVADSLAEYFGREQNE